MNEQALIAMKHDIIELGVNKVWFIIENMSNPIVRLRYRHLLFKAVRDLQGR